MTIPAFFVFLVFLVQIGLIFISKFELLRVDEVM